MKPVDREVADGRETWVSVGKSEVCANPSGSARASGMQARFLAHSTCVEGRGPEIGLSRSEASDCFVDSVFFCSVRSEVREAIDATEACCIDACEEGENLIAKEVRAVFDGVKRKQSKWDYLKELTGSGGPEAELAMFCLGVGELQRCNYLEGCANLCDALGDMFYQSYERYFVEPYADYLNCFLPKLVPMVLSLYRGSKNRDVVECRVSVKDLKRRMVRVQWIKDEKYNPLWQAIDDLLKL